MFGPLTLILRDPIIALVLVVAFLPGLVLHGVLQARLAARLGDKGALNAGFGGLEPLQHFNLGALVWYLLLGLGLTRSVPLRLGGRRALLVLLSGPLTLALWAFLLMVLRQLLQSFMPALDVVYGGMRLAAVALVLHALFYLVPFPALDGGRALWEVGGPSVRRVLGQLAVASPLALYILWVVLWLSGVGVALLNPLWSLLQTVLGWLPF